MRSMFLTFPVWYFWMIHLFRSSHHVPTSVVNPGHLNMEHDHSNLSDSLADLYVCKYVCISEGHKVE